MSHIFAIQSPLAFVRQRLCAGALVKDKSYCAVESLIKQCLADSGISREVQS